jgi:exosortase
MNGTDRPIQSCRVTAWRTLILLLAVAWVYWPALEQMARRWSQDPQYTHGYVVPLFAIIVLWFRRDTFPAASIRPTWWGLPLVLLSGLLYLAGTLFSFEWLEAGSMIPALAGLLLLAAGPAVLRWGWPAGAFLLFILPWPWQFDDLLTFPLRRVATVASTWSLQTLGIPALARGNIIVINEREIGVIEACSGLGMLMTFFALSTAVAFVIQRPRFERIVIFLSAAPIGVLMNIVRITVTVLLYEVASAELARIVFHDVAGWVMMPLALLVLWLELLFLDRLWLPVEQTGPVPVSVVLLPGPASDDDRGDRAGRPLPRSPGQRVPEMKSRPEETVEHSLQEIPDVVP